ncbi:probable histone-arginine methyltransferase 1.3 isoform X2 [Actinidia eriantha]|uniref:probable histone-arginine methyltransferase 1.3 isoform X2 n=1 Tax=Actinidia eriantha TaxID=165200 RepID=UPI00258C243D|nr:probable histone-arginine methyltransferase 1.3 isoform X2 [Actinidia eriantha]
MYVWYIAITVVRLKNKAMEFTVGQNHKFNLASVSELASSSSRASDAPAGARVSFDSGAAELRFYRESKSNKAIYVPLRTAQLFKLSPVESVCISESSETSKEKSYSRGITIQFRKDEESRAFHCAFEQWKKEVVVQGSCSQNGTFPASNNKFDDKIAASSAKTYFNFYGQLTHQKNMLLDYEHIMLQSLRIVRILLVVWLWMLVLVPAGAKHVYAVEASEMAECACKLIAGNPSLGQRITVVKGKIEEVELPEKADILISEPMGILLVNERMLETYVIARDRFLLPNGKMFPTIGRIHMAPFSDEYLYVERANEALFWQQPNYYGVDLTPLYGSAFHGYLSKPVVNAFDPRVLVAPEISHVINFTSIKEEELYEIDVPLKFIASMRARIHGLACWFDVLFDGSVVQRWLTTAPGAPTTHWNQVRCFLLQPLDVMPGQEITGRLHMVAHESQSYTVHLTMSTKMCGPGADQERILQSSSCKFDLGQYHY